jgi:TPR repeat protein
MSQKTLSRGNSAVSLPLEIQTIVPERQISQLSSQEEKVDSPATLAFLSPLDPSLGEERLLIEEVKTLAVKLRMEGQENKKLSIIKGSNELIRRIDEVFSEIEEQYSKIITAMKTSKSVVENLRLLKAAMKDIEGFYAALKSAWMFLSKSKLTLRMQNHYQTLRGRCTQLLTAVSLELLSGRNAPAAEETPVLGSELYHTGLYYFHGLHGKPKNYIFAFEKFVQGAEMGDGECMVMTANCYLHGYGVEENDTIGWKWLEKAANYGKCPHAKTEFAHQIILKLKRENKNAIKQFFQLERRKSISEIMTGDKHHQQQHYGTRPSFDGNDMMGNNNGPATYGSVMIDDPTTPFDTTEGEFEEDELIHHDLQYAMKLLLEAAGEGHIEAKTLLGTIYDESGDYEAAAKWYSLASNGGCSRATCLLANLLFYSKTQFVGTRQKAFSLFSMAARNGSPEAFNGLGLCYESGIGVEMNLISAIVAYRQGAKLGNSQAMYNLGYLLVKNAIEIMDENSAKNKTKKTTRLSNKVINNDLGAEEEEIDEIELFSELGIRVEDALKEGIHWLRAAAENQIPDAAFQLGRLYEQAIGLPFDETAALSNYMFAANLNHSRSALFGANLCYKNNDMDSPNYMKNMLKVAKLYLQAATAGEVEAMNSYALLAEDGRANAHTQRDIYLAASWYYEACKNRYLPSFLNLALLLASESIYSFPSLQGEMVSLSQALQFLEEELPREIDQDRLDSFTAFYERATAKSKVPAIGNANNEEDNGNMFLNPLNEQQMVSNQKPILHHPSSPSHHHQNNSHFSPLPPAPLPPLPMVATKDPAVDYDRVRNNVDQWKTKIQNQNQRIGQRNNNNQLTDESASLVLADNNRRSFNYNDKIAHLNSREVSSENVAIFQPQNYYAQKNNDLYVQTNSRSNSRTNSPEHDRARQQQQMKNNNNFIRDDRKVSFNQQQRMDSNNNSQQQHRQYVDMAFPSSSKYLPLQLQQQKQQQNHNNNDHPHSLTRAGEMYVTNGAIPPPLYVPKAIAPEKPSGASKPDLPAKSYSHNNNNSLLFPSEVRQSRERNHSFSGMADNESKGEERPNRKKENNNNGNNSGNDRPREYSPKRKETMASYNMELQEPLHNNPQEQQEEDNTEAKKVTASVSFSSFHFISFHFISFLILDHFILLSYSVDVESFL